jgi:MoaA/NifB/PqqE/SkfB family radical SAM enzyme
MLNKKLKIENQDILVGSSRINTNNKAFNRIEYMEKNMQFNKAYMYYLEENNLQDIDQSILGQFITEYKNYRNDWVNPIRRQNANRPLCVDIETASICNLACPHCSREYIITPDKVMDEDLFIKIVDESALLKVPSMKMNWRGEPLLNPRLTKMINYAKRKGILEILINTNAVTLTEEKANEIIDSGLDVMIYSFDGGTKETYEKMRPGRFKENNFEDVYSKIKRFSEIKKERSAKFPITKIQMILTEDSRKEVNQFYELFGDIVDEVTITQYNERGGNFNSLTLEQRDAISGYFTSNNLPNDTPYLVDFDGNIFISRKRKPCEQIFQRLMITFDGRIGMCCHDWGARHGIGFIDEKAFDQNKLTNEVDKKIKNNSKGFELLKNAKSPENFNEPIHKVESLSEIWEGNELKKVRDLHLSDKLDEVKVCSNCTFKDTYNWERIN